MATLRATECGKSLLWEEGVVVIEQEQGEVGWQDRQTSALPTTVAGTSKSCCMCDQGRICVLDIISMMHMSDG
jgi:hypothetical protein